MKQISQEQRVALARAIAEYQAGLHLQLDGSIARNPEFQDSSKRKKSG
jgi:hypothetical protein